MPYPFLRPEVLNRLMRRLGAKSSDYPQVLADQIVVTLGVQDLLAGELVPKLQNLSVADQAVTAGVDVITTFNDLANWSPARDSLIVATRLGFQSNGGLGAWDASLSKGATWAASTADDAEFLEHYNVDVITLAGAWVYPPIKWLPSPVFAKAGEAWRLNGIVKNRQAAGYNLTFLAMIVYAPTD